MEHGLAWSGEPLAYAHEGAAPLLEQTLCPLCDPWREHLGLLLAVLAIGVVWGIVIMSLLRFVSEESRAERQREAEYAAEQERLAALRRQVTKPAAEVWTEPVTARQRSLEHPADRAWAELDETVVREPPIERRAPRGGRR